MFAGNDLIKKIVMCLVLLLGLVQNCYAQTAAEYLKLGIEYGKKGDLNQAISEFTSAIKADPDLAKAWYNRGLAYSKLNRRDLAIADYTKAIEQDSNYTAAFFNRGSSYYKTGKADQARADFEQCIKIKPDEPRPYEAIAYIHFDNKDYEKAWDAVHKAESLGYKPDNEDLELLNKLKKASGKDK